MEIQSLGFQTLRFNATSSLDQDTDCYLRQGAHPAWQGASGTEFAGGTYFLKKNSVLQVSGRNTLENVIKITSKSKFSTHFVQIPYHLHPARQGVHPALSNSL